MVLALHLFCSCSLKLDRFPDALWVDATNDETITGSFKGIGLSIGVGPGIEDVLLWLASRNVNWIVVFNNADDPKLDLAKYFPKCSHGNILITTRNYHARRYGVGPGSDYGVAEMKAPEALVLFRKHARLFGDADPSLIEIAKVLVEEIGRFALAVTQAGAYISTSRCSLSQYRDLYRDQREELLRYHEETPTTDNYEYLPLHATWMISYVRLSDPAKELFQVFGCVHHEDIKEEIFSNAYSHGVENLESDYGALFTEIEWAGLAKLKKFGESVLTNGKWDTMKFRGLLGELESYSFMRFHPERGTCSIHPLMHEWVGSVRDVNEQPILSHCALLLLGSSLVGYETAEELAFCRGLACHVDQALQETGLHANACSGFFGRVYSEAGRLDDAVIHAELFRELCSRVLGEENPDTLVSTNDLAFTYSELGRSNDAERLQLQVVEASRRLLGPEHPFTLNSMNNLARTYSELGRSSDAEKLELQVVVALRRLLGPEHPSTLTSMSNLALTYSRLGRSNDAQKLQLQVLEARKRLLGSEHPDTLISMSNLASTYSELGRPSDAEKLELQVLEAQKRLLGPEHPSTLNSMCNLASTYSDLGRPGDAEELQLQVLEARERLLGPEHPSTLNSMINIARTYSDLGRFNDAEKLQLQVVEVQNRLLGPEHPSMLTSMCNLASTYSDLGRPCAAEKLKLQILEARKRLLGPEHPDTLTSMNNLAATYSDLGRFKDAEKLELRVGEARRRLLGPEHPSTLTSMNNLASTYSDLGRLGDAEKLQLQVLEARKRLLGPEHPSTLNSMSNLAVTYSDLRRPGDAETLQLRVLEARKRILGPKHPHTLFSAYNLASCHRKQGKLAEVEELAQHTFTACLCVLGADHPNTINITNLLSKIQQQRRNGLERLTHFILCSLCSCFPSIPHRSHH